MRRGGIRSFNRKTLKMRKPIPLHQAEGVHVDEEGGFWNFVGFAECECAAEEPG